MVYVAMFDESTAIFKVSDSLLVSDVARFVDWESMPSDHYLWLTGKVTK
ncbi:MAG: hypothetical protein LBV64_04905 [Mediterranea sp.]|jgi:hypothetical protein|nr:hypothetical protein [Mediterranea sp.]